MTARRRLEAARLRNRAAEGQRFAVFVPRRQGHPGSPRTCRCEAARRRRASPAARDRRAGRGRRGGACPRALRASAVASSGSAMVASACTVTWSASRGELAPALRLLQRGPRRAAEVRDVGHDLQRVPVTADRGMKNAACTVAWLMKFLGVPPPSTMDGRPRPSNDQVGRFDDVADDIDLAGVPASCGVPARAPCRSTNRQSPDRRSARAPGRRPSGCRRPWSRSTGASPSR